MDSGIFPVTKVSKMRYYYTLETGKNQVTAISFVSLPVLLLQGGKKRFHFLQFAVG